MPVQQDEKEIEAKKAPTGEILKGSMEDIRKEKEKILEAEKKKAEGLKKIPLSPPLNPFWRN